MTARYAIYFTPEDKSDLAYFGACALGRMPDGSDLIHRKELLQCDDALNSDIVFTDKGLAKELRERPAHYGFHATLKAPFPLAENKYEEELLESVEAFSKLQQVISLESLQLRKISGFMALTLERQPESLLSLAEQCVRRFEPFRAPLTEEDLQKRRPDDLDEQQRTYLFEFGYPYVLKEFRFHMTLTGPLKGHEHTEYIDWLASLYKNIVQNEPTLDRLAVFKQFDRSSPFKRLVEIPFGRLD